MFFNLFQVFLLVFVMLVHPRFLEVVARTRANHKCLIITDADGQKIKLQQSSPHSIRVRAIPNGTSSFRDDLVSALDQHPDDGTIACKIQSLGESDAPQSLVNGNLKAEVLPDSRIKFTRVSDGKSLLQEIRPRRFGNAAIPFNDFFSLEASFEGAPSAEENEKLYGQFSRID